MSYISNSERRRKEIKEIIHERENKTLSKNAIKNHSYSFIEFEDSQRDYIPDSNKSRKCFDSIGVYYGKNLFKDSGKITIHNLGNMFKSPVEKQVSQKTGRVHYVLVNKTVK